MLNLFGKKIWKCIPAIDVIPLSKFHQIWLRFALFLFDFVPVTVKRTIPVPGGQVWGQADSYHKLTGGQV